PVLPCSAGTRSLPRDAPLVSRVESTQTQVRTVADARQERQLIAGRYRLVSFHRGDESTEVWRALDESTTHVVSLEFLRDTDPAAKERFLAGAPRLAPFPHLSVMRVASIHDDRDGTFIVFEHIVDIPVRDEWLQPGTVETVAVEPSPTPATSTSEATADAPVATSSAEVASEKSSDRGLSMLTYAINAREFSLIDMPLLSESASELLALTLSELKTVRLDPTVLSDLLAYRPNLSLLMSPFGLVGGAL